MTTSLLKLGVLTAKDFSRTPEGGLYLDRDSKRRYFTEYEKLLNEPFESEGITLTFRTVFRRQAERLAAYLTRGEPYESFTLPC